MALLQLKPELDQIYQIARTIYFQLIRNSSYKNQQQ